METQNISMVYQVRKWALVEGSYFLGSDISSVRIMEKKLRVFNNEVWLEVQERFIQDHELVVELSEKLLS